MTNSRQNDNPSTPVILSEAKDLKKQKPNLLKQ